MEELSVIHASMELWLGAGWGLSTVENTYIPHILYAGSQPRTSRY